VAIHGEVVNIHNPLVANARQFSLLAPVLSLFWGMIRVGRKASFRLAVFVVSKK
jgi:hypothetical protein